MIWEEIGQRIKNLRHDKKLTQTQFGKLINISRQSVSKIERGQKLSVEQIDAICKKTGVTIEYILYGITDSSANLDFLDELSSLQIDIGLDILKRLAELIKTPNGNKLLINELMWRKCPPLKG